MPVHEAEIFGLTLSRYVYGVPGTSDLARGPSSSFDLKYFDFRINTPLDLSFALNPAFSALFAINEAPERVGMAFLGRTLDPELQREPCTQQTQKICTGSCNTAKSPPQPARSASTLPQADWYNSGQAIGLSEEFEILSGADHGHQITFAGAINSQSRLVTSLRVNQSRRLGRIDRSADRPINLSRPVNQDRRMIYIPLTYEGIVSRLKGLDNYQY
ncbi:hypothetical protein DFH07DRAFT_776625 [Mycena maculata]|uniref:Uncharacterized protein n=1 Tax=Mycena maculata TaxID=230809 RepID=A0AAD7N4S9_9AGAR|nr:hypothetical protein DFH07DRAFT_776625 [Mycena maculata]